MRVLFWTEKFLPYLGGTEKSAAMTLRALRMHGHEFTIVTDRYYLPLPERELWQDIPIYRFPFLETLGKNDPVAWLTLTKQIAQLKREFAPELIHMFCFGPSALAHLQTRSASDAPLLVRLNWFEQEPTKAFARNSVLLQTLQDAAWTITVSKAILDLTLPFVPEIAPRTSVLYNGHFEPLVQPAPLPMPPRILSLARHAHEKGLDVALDAFAQVYARFPDARFIVGGDGVERTNLQDQARALGLQDVIEFTGWVPLDQVPMLLNRATIMVVPSRHEGFGNVAIEAAQMERPVIASRVEGLAEIVRDQETGLLVEPEDSDGLANALTFLIEHPERAAQLGQAARADVRERFSVERLVKEYDALYRRLRNSTK